MPGLPGASSLARPATCFLALATDGLIPSSFRRPSARLPPGSTLASANRPSHPRHLGSQPHTRARRPAAGPGRRAPIRARSTATRAHVQPARSSSASPAAHMARPCSSAVAARRVRVSYSPPVEGAASPAAGGLPAESKTTSAPSRAMRARVCLARSKRSLRASAEPIPASDHATSSLSSRSSAPAALLYRRC
jgi:hypothetical protein